MLPEEQANYPATLNQKICINSVPTFFGSRCQMAFFGIPFTLMKFTFN